MRLELGSRRIGNKQHHASLMDDISSIDLLIRKNFDVISMKKCNTGKHFYSVMLYASFYQKFCIVVGMH